MLQNARFALVALSVAACAESQPPIVASSEPRDASAPMPVDASAPIAEDAAPTSTPDSAPTAPAPPACATNDVDLAKVTSGCGGTPPSAASDLDVGLALASPLVAPDATVTLTLRITNTSGRAIALDMVKPVNDDLRVEDGKGAGVTPPNGTPSVSYERYCATVDCVTPDLDVGRARVAVVLLPGGVAHAELTWKAERLAWPKKTVRLACCAVPSISYVRVGPLADGSYVASITLRVAGTANVWKTTAPIAVKK